MENHFQQIPKEVFHNLSPKQEDLVRKVFFAGAASLMHEIAIVRTLPDGLAEERLQALLDEIHNFSMKVIKEAQ